VATSTKAIEANAMKNARVFAGAKFTVFMTED
jgi:hypothetical protein